MASCGTETEAMSHQSLDEDIEKAIDKTMDK